MSVEAGSQVVLTKPVRQPGQRRSLGSYLAMPLILAAICLAMYLYVATKDLDSIEARALSSQRLGTALWQHIQLTVVSTALTLIIAVPLGVLLTRGFMRRVQPVRTPRRNPEVGDTREDQMVRFQLKLNSLEFSADTMYVRVLTCPLNPALVNGDDYALREVTDSSNPIERTFEAVVDVSG